MFVLFCYVGVVDFTVLIVKVIEVIFIIGVLVKVVDIVENVFFF